MAFPWPGVPGRVRPLADLPGSARRGKPAGGSAPTQAMCAGPRTAKARVACLLGGRRGYGGES